jgi:hypothetical protein
MATERQIAANRANASKSTGPRSSGGRKRTSRNAYRHGLAARAAWSARLARAIERLARKIAGKSTNPIILEWARAAAQAEFDVERIREVKVAAIQQTLKIETCSLSQTAITYESLEAEATPQSLERTARAARGALPELLKLERYQRRASARRDQALRALIRVRTRHNNQGL